MSLNEKSGATQSKEETPTPVPLDRKWILILEHLHPCFWPDLGRYLYGRNYRKLPPECQKCWKALAFFKDRESFQSFCRVLQSASRSFHYKLIELGVVGYARSKEETERIMAEFSRIADEAGVDCRITQRWAGRYWQDLFPEFFGKSVRGYRAFYSRLFDFRKKADKLASLEEIEKLAIQMLGVEAVFGVLGAPSEDTRKRGGLSEARS